MINFFYRKIYFLLIFFLFLCSLCALFIFKNRWDITYLQSHYLEGKALTLTQGYFFVPNNDLSSKVALEHNLLRKNPQSLLSQLFSPGSLLSFWGQDELNYQCLRPLVLQEKFLVMPQGKGFGFERHPDFENQVQSLTDVRLALPENFAPPGQTDLSPSSRGNRIFLQARGQYWAKSPHPRYCFPVSYPFSFKDTWGDPRSNDRFHEGTDIFAEEGTEVYAVIDGVIHNLATLNGAGHTIFLRGRDGKGYCYMHLQGYAEGITEGKVVKKGELIAYVGRSGLIAAPAHLHFQVHDDHNFVRHETMNPYEFLVSLCQGRGVADLGSPKKFSGKRVERHQLVSFREGPKSENFLVVNKPLITWSKPLTNIPPAKWVSLPSPQPRRKMITVLDGR